MLKAINLKQKLALIDTPWQPRVIAELNDYQLKLARLEGEFVWHAHEHTDEMFLCLNGELTIQTDAGDVILHEGEVYAVPRGVRHRP